MIDIFIIHYIFSFDITVLFNMYSLIYDVSHKKTDILARISLNFTQICKYTYDYFNNYYNKLLVLIYKPIMNNDAFLEVVIEN